MKIRLLLILIVINLSGYSQNWKLIDDDRVYNYTHSDSSIITNTIWADSVNIENGDSTYYLNTIAIPCDTCTDLTYYLAFQPNFLECKYIQVTDSICWFSGKSSITILPFCEIGGQWLFDTLNNINATCTEIREELSFGVTDSVKLIALSNGDSILISKVFGIKQYPDINNSGYYLLSGIDNEDIGETVPGFHEIFDFNVGDIFQYEFWRYGGGDSHDSSFKYKILSKEVNSDTIKYTVKQIGFDIFHSSIGTHPPSYYNGEVEWELINKPGILNSSYMNDYHLLYSSNLFNNEMHTPFPNDDYYFSITSFSLDENDIFTKESGVFKDFWDWEAPALYGLYDSLLVPEGPEVFHLQYKEHLGITDSRIYWFEGANSANLIGYVKGNDTTGTVYSDEYLLSVKDIYNNSEFKIYPNPASKFINIENTMQLNYNFELFDNLGRSILNEEISNSEFQRISISHLKSGIYLYKICSGIELIKGKILIE